MEKVHLLIVDDRPENLFVLEQILDRPDLNIIKANSGNEALKLLFQHDFFLILLDVQMPGMDGFETAELMRGSKKTRHIPIIFVTAISKEQKNIFKGYESGAVDYIFKPVEPEILKSKVNVFLELHRQKKKAEIIARELEKTVSELREAQTRLQNAKEDAENLVEIRTAELRESEKKYRGIFENAMEGIFQSTRDGRYISANPALASFLGYDSPKDLIENMTDIRNTLYAVPERRDELFRLLREDGVVRGFEVPLFHKKGHRIWGELHARPVFNEKHEMLYMEGIVQDITMRKEKEKAEREKEIAEAANRKIMDSIQYARIIQRSLLPNLKDVRYYLPDSFFLWKPRDVVSGDLYYAECFDDGIAIAVMDCTGHGVPGAFMTMLASSGLRRILRTEKCHNPAEILNWLNFIIKTSLQQDTEYALSDDGLDAAICFVKPEENTLTYAGAHIPLYYVHNDEIHMIRGDRQSLGYRRSDLHYEFSNHVIAIEKGMKFYLSSDGFADQLGGERGRRFGTGAFQNLLRKASAFPFDQQESVLLTAFLAYKGEQENVDDVTVAGFGFDTKGQKDRRRGLPDRRECFIDRRRGE